MRVYQIDGSFGLEQLKLTERPTPEPGPGQVRLKMTAASLNYRDLLMVRGHYNPRQPLPLVPCSDGVGVIDAVGVGVQRLRVGQRVATLFAQGWLDGQPSNERIRHTLGGPLDGTLADHMVLPELGVIPVPSHLSDAEAATLPCAGLTAWSALITQGQLTAGDTVLILGTGGVSLFALQFAKRSGARVIITSSSDEKLQRARALGADETINYRTTPEWGREVKRLTQRRGVDHVVEVGGAGTLKQSLRAVRTGGCVSLIGVLAGSREPLDILPILMRNIRLQGILVGHRSGFAAMNRAIEAHAIRPVVDRVFPFEEAPAAFAHLAEAKHMGKVCIGW